MPSSSHNSSDSEDAAEEPSRKRVKRDPPVIQEDLSDNNTNIIITSPKLEDDDDVDFTLHLADQQVLRVSKTQSQKLQSFCPFFRNAFRHGTKECEQRIIAKPDWSLPVAKAIVALTSTESHKLMVPQDDYDGFKEAADQILLPIRICNPVSGQDIQNESLTIHQIAATWKAATTVFTMDMTCRNNRRRNSRNNNNNNNNNQGDEVWNDLLAAGTVFVDGEQQPDGLGLRVELVVDESNNSNSNNPQQTSLEPANLLAVGSFAPLPVSVYHTCIRLSESLRNRRRVVLDTNNSPACMALPLYLGGRQLLEQQFPDFEFLTIEANNVPNVLNMTRVTAQFTALRSVLKAAVDLIAPVNLSKLCYLLVPDPSITVLGHLLAACQKCTDNPGTMGWDLEKNQFCTLKTVEDTQFILDEMATGESKNSSIKGVSGTIRLVNVDMTSAPAWSAY